MIRTVFAAAIVALAIAAVPGVSSAAPASSLPAGVANEATSGHVVQAYCGWHCRHWHRWHHWCRWHRC